MLQFLIVIFGNIGISVDVSLSKICPGPSTIPGCVACAKFSWRGWGRPRTLTIGDTVGVDLTLNCRTFGSGLFAMQKIDFRNAQCMESEGTTESFQMMS